MNILIFTDWRRESEDLQRTRSLVAKVKLQSTEMLHKCSVIAGLLRNEKVLFCFCFVSLLWSLLFEGDKGKGNVAGERVESESAYRRPED